MMMKLWVVLAVSLSPSTGFLFGRKRRTQKALFATCKRLQREIDEASLAERTLLEQLRQIRTTATELQDKLRKNVEESEGALANATAYATRLEKEVAALKTQLSHKEKEVEASRGRESAAENELNLMKQLVNTTKSELDNLRRELANAKAKAKQQRATQPVAAVAAAAAAPPASSPPPAVAPPAADAPPTKPAVKRPSSTSSKRPRTEMSSPPVRRKRVSPSTASGSVPSRPRATTRSPASPSATG